MYQSLGMPNSITGSPSGNLKILRSRLHTLMKALNLSFVGFTNELGKYLSLCKQYTFVFRTYNLKLYKIQAQE